MTIKPLPPFEPPDLKLTPMPEPTRLEVIELRPDDVLVLRCPGPICREDVVQLEHVLEQKFPGRRCLVLGDGLTLDVLRETPAEHVELPDPPGDPDGIVTWKSL